MSKYDLALIKQRNRIHDVARECGHQVKKNRMRCIQPENHKNGDRHPSLILYADTNRYWCSSCGIKGDLIDFVKIALQLDFRSAVEYLATRSGIQPNDTFKKRDYRSESGKEKPLSTEFREVYEYFFELCSDLTDEAVRWLDNRCISKSTAEKLRIKYLLKERHVSESLYERYPLELLIKSGLVNSDSRLFCRRHKMIVTTFKDNRPIYFQGRSLNTNTRPKEMCISASIPYPYNVDILKSNPRRVFLCEGLIDALTLIDRGLSAVGVTGANGFKDQWLKLFHGMTVVIAFDSDKVGENKGNELVEKFHKAGIDAERLHLPDGYDVNRLFNIYRHLGI